MWTKFLFNKVISFHDPYKISLFFLIFSVLNPIPTLALGEEYITQSTDKSLISNAKFSEEIWQDAVPYRSSLSPEDFIEVRVVCNGYYLGFGLWVKDTDIRNDHWNEKAKGETWVDDSIEIYLDCLGDGGDIPRIDDFKIHFDTTPKYDIWGMPDNIWTDQGNGKNWQPVYKPDWKKFMPRIRRSFAILGGKPNDPRDQDAGYIWEVLVPWDILSVKRHETKNKVIGWCLIARDRDSDGENTDYFATLPSKAHSNAPSTWGKLIIPPLSQNNTPKIMKSNPLNVALPNNPDLIHLINLGWTILSPERSQLWDPPTGRPSILYLRSKNVNPCDMMDNRILADSEIRTALSSYQLFVLDITGYFQDHALVKKHNIIRVPSFVLFDANGNPIRRIGGFQEKKDFLVFLGKPSP